MRVHSITHNALCCWQQHVWPDQLFLHREQQQSITDNSPFISAAAPPGGCGSEGGAGIKVDGSEPPPPLVHYFTKVFFLIFWGTYILFHQCVPKRNKMFWVTWVTLFENNFWTFFILVSWPHSVSSPVTQMMSQISSWIESMRQVWQKWPES